MSGITPKYKCNNIVTSPIVDKPDNEKTPPELKHENKYLRAENVYLKKLDALLRQREPAATK